MVPLKKITSSQRKCYIEKSKHVRAKETATIPCILHHQFSCYTLLVIKKTYSEYVLHLKVKMCSPQIDVFGNNYDEAITTIYHLGCDEPLGLINI